MWPDGTATNNIFYSSSTGVTFTQKLKYSNQQGWEIIQDWTEIKAPKPKEGKQFLLEF